MSSNVNPPEEKIRALLKEYAFYQAMDFTTEEFCSYAKVDEAVLQDWIARYPDYDDDAFIDINIVRSLSEQQPAAEKRPSTAPPLFAKVGDIEIYQQMPAAFLKSLRP